MRDLHIPLLVTLSCYFCLPNRVKLNPQRHLLTRWTRGKVKQSWDYLSSNVPENRGDLQRLQRLHDRHPGQIVLECKTLKLNFGIISLTSSLLYYQSFLIIPGISLAQSSSDVTQMGLDTGLIKKFTLITPQKTIYDPWILCVFPTSQGWLRAFNLLKCFQICQLYGMYMLPVFPCILYFRFKLCTYSAKKSTFWTLHFRNTS